MHWSGTHYDMELANRQHGGHWFDREWMRAMKTRLGTIYNGPAGIYFVHSSVRWGDEVRVYLVAQFNPDTGSVDTAMDHGPDGDWMGLTRSAAHRKARRLAGSV